MRRIRLCATNQVYQLRPDFVMPYMVGRRGIGESQRRAYLDGPLQRVVRRRTHRNGLCATSQ